jgi:hypothetical protein
LVLLEPAADDLADVSLCPIDHPLHRSRRGLGETDFILSEDTGQRCLVDVNPQGSVLSHKSLASFFKAPHRVPDRVVLAVVREPSSVDSVGETAVVRAIRRAQKRGDLPRRREPDRGAVMAALDQRDASVGQVLRQV